MTADQQAGWYPDPSGDATKLRYWNGVQWTEDFAAAQPPTYPADGYSSPAYTPQPPSQGDYPPTQGYHPQNQGYYPPTQGYYYPSQTSLSETDQTLRLIAFILSIISTVTLGWLLIPLIWMIPMSVICWGVYRGTKANTVAYGVCMLLFVNIISGILLLASKKDSRTSTD